jgi:hypothetical protein
MPLLDFFPDEDSCEEGRSFQIMWLARITDALNHQLPDRQFFAQIRLRTWLQTEEDVAAFEYDPPSIFDEEGHDTGRRYGSVTPSPPDHTVATSCFDNLSANLIDSLEGHDVCGIVRLVCRSNKTSRESDLAFAVDCASQLQRGAGLVVVDIIPRRRAVWADHLGSLLHCADWYHRGRGHDMVVTSFRPARRRNRSEVDIWNFPVSFDDLLPTVPLAAKGSMFLSVDLESTYTQTLKEKRYDCRKP